MRPTVLLGLLLAAPALAGCLAAGDPPEAPPQVPGLSDYPDPIPEGEGHDHTDPSQHAFATPNVALLAHHGLGESADATIGHYGEIDTLVHPETGRTLAAVAVTGIGGEMPGFVILDSTDPRAPERLAWVESPLTGRLADVKWHPSGKWLFAAAQSGTRPLQPGTHLADQESAEHYASQNGLRLYDTTDPAAPKLVQQEPSRTGYGCHMFSYAEIGGAEWIFCTGRTIEVWSFVGGRLEFRSQYVFTPDGGLRNLLDNDRSNAQAFLLTETRLAVTPHDHTYQLDPIDGRPLLLVSWWDMGARIVDVSDPMTPKEVGAWTGEGAVRWEGNTHSAMLAEIGGRRILFSTPELLSDNPPALWAVDVTDFADPAYVGEWTAPGEHGAEGLRLSTHNIQIVGERVYLAHYHAGVWVLDASDPAAVAPVGWYLPHSTIEPTEPREAVWAPNVWDVVVRDGAIYASDSHQGLFVLHEASDALGDPAATSFA